MKGIQIIGTQRSGSNLLRVMLHQSSRICAPHPPHILRTFFPILEMYGDLSDDGNFHQLIADLVELIRLNPVNWNIAFNVGEILDHCENPSLPQLLKAVYEIKTEKKHAQIWCCKSMANVKYFHELESSGVHPFYIYLYRDGRDVALSFKKAVVGEKHIYSLAKQWRQDQIQAMNLCNEIGDERVLRIGYERFIEDPSSVLTEICNRLNIPFEPSMLGYFTSEESKNTAEAGVMWNNLTKPVLSQNRNKFVTELTPDEILIFESVVGDVLERLDYRLINSKENHRKEFSTAETDGFTVENKRMKEAFIKTATLDMEKRQAQEEFIDSLKKRYSIFKEQQTR
jgi:hypothetical protein